MRDRAAPGANPEELLADTGSAGSTEQHHERYVGGSLPPVHDSTGKGGGQSASASEIAFAEDDNVRELKTKVGNLVAHKYGGDYKAAFDHYDADKDGGVDKNELYQLLSDAGVGNGMTRGTWAGKIIEKLDASGDAKIEWTEFQSVFTATA